MRRITCLSMFLFLICQLFPLYGAPARQRRMTLCTPAVLEPSAAAAAICIQSPQERADGHLPPSEIIRHSLVLSGCEPGTPLFADIAARFDAFLKTVSSAEILQLPPLERGDRVLELMHRTFLKQYRAMETRMQSLALNGTYNCVSSGVLYLAAARAAGLDVRGEGTTAHAFCSVLIDGRYYDVETTNMYGFNPGSKKEFHDTFGKTTGFAYVPVKNYARRAPMSDRAYLALISGNLSAESCNNGDFTAGIPPAALRVDYIAAAGTGDEYDFAVEELHKVCTNYVKVLQQRHYFKESLEWAAAAVNRRGFSYIWQQCLDVAVTNATGDALNLNAVDTAAEYVAAWRPRLSRERLAGLDSMVRIGYLYRDISGMTPDQKLEYLDHIDLTAVAGDVNLQKQLAEIRESSWLQKAEAASSGGDFLAGAEVISAALKQVGTSARLENAHSLYVKNYCITVHNAFAALFNRRNYEDARTVVADGLARVPDNAMLKKDLRTVESVLTVD